MTVHKCSQVGRLQVSLNFPPVQIPWSLDMRSCAACSTKWGETYLVSEHRLEGQRSQVEPPQGTISAPR